MAHILLLDMPKSFYGIAVYFLYNKIFDSHKLFDISVS